MKRRTYQFARKCDVWILAAIFLLCVLVWLFPLRTRGQYAEILVDNHVCAKVSLASDCENFSVNGADGFRFTVKNSEIAVVSAPCPNQVCIHSGAISKTGQQIVCLPYHLQITIIDEQSAPDAVL